MLMKLEMMRVNLLYYYIAYTVCKDTMHCVIQLGVYSTKLTFYAIMMKSILLC